MSRVLRSPVFLGAGLGAACAFSPGFVFVMLLAVATAWFLYRFVRKGERRFVVALFVAGFFARTALSLGLDLGSWIVEGHRPLETGVVQEWDLGIRDKTRAYLGMGDSDYYSQRGYAIAQYAKGVREPVVLFRVQQYGSHGYAYVMGAFYYLFGFSPVAVKMVNCFLGALLGPALFFLLKGCFDSSVARWASLIVSFFPSLLFWSASNLKESSFMLLTVLVMLLFVKIQQARSGRARIGAGCLFLFTLSAHMTLRSVQLSLSLVECLVLSRLLLFLWAKKGWGRWVLGLLVTFLGFHMESLRSTLNYTFYRHIGYTGEAGLSYRYLPGAFYIPGYLDQWISSREANLPFLPGSLGRAIFHYMVEPIPSKMDSFSLLLAYPQMVLWYFLLPFMFLGVVWSLRWNLRRTLFLVLTVATWVLMGALSNGNVGTVFRIRDMVTPFFLAFACAGLQTFFRVPSLSDSPPATRP